MSGAGVMQGMSMGYSIGQSVAALYEGWENGRTNKYVLKKQAEIAEANRAMAEMAAESAFRQGEAQIAQLTYQAGQVKAQQRTAFASNGVRVGVGSTAEKLASTDIMKRMDTLNARMAALNQAWGFKQQAYQQQGLKNAYKSASGYAMSISMGQGLMKHFAYAAEAGEKYMKHKGGFGAFAGSSGAAGAAGSSALGNDAVDAVSSAQYSPYGR